MRLRSQLLWLCSALLLLPWLGYQYLQDMQGFLLRGQESAQQLTAQAVATLLQTRTELLQTVAVPASEPALYVWPTDQFMVLDGYEDDWDSRIEALAVGPIPGADGRSPLAYTLRLAQRLEQLFMLVQVEDSQPVYRHPGFPALERSDHLRIALRYGGALHRYVVAVEAIGAAQVFPADERWRRLDSNERPPLRAHWQDRAGGYQIELVFPVALFNEDARIWLAVADVDDPRQRQPLVMLPIGSHLGRPLHLHSPELQRLIAGLRQSGRHIWVLDRAGVVRAVSNLQDATPDLLRRAAPSIARVLKGEAVVQRYHSGAQEQILAAEPILDEAGELIGAVVVEVATRTILDLQRSTLLKTAAITVAVFLLLLLGVLLFAARLTLRIRQLGRVTREALDERGRVRRAGLDGAELGSDEVGDLGRDITTLVARLYHYTRYLERMPRTLQHELRNPLNTIGTSLEMLRDSPLAAAEARYLASAERGVGRLSDILHALTEAASLEEALRTERREPLDLIALAERYLEQHRQQYGAFQLRLDSALRSAPIAGNEARLEQALDKLFDNAVDFAPASSVLLLSLVDADPDWELALFNRGPAVPAELASSLFDSLVTGRGGGADAVPHLGIGLYVVRLIVEAHGGRVAFANQDGGVRVSLRLPKRV